MVAKVKVGILPYPRGEGESRSAPRGRIETVGMMRLMVRVRARVLLPEMCDKVMLLEELILSMR